MGILYIHDLVTDIVGRLHYIHKRMAGIAQRLARSREAQQPKLVGHTYVVLAFADKKAELALFRKRRLIRILDNRSQRGISHGKTALAAPLELMRKHPEGIGIALETRQVGPFRLGKLRTQNTARTFTEKCRHRFLAAMAERRIAKIMRQTCRRHNIAYMVEMFRTCCFAAVTATKLDGHGIGHRLAYASNLHRMGQTVVHKDTPGQRKHLGLVLQAPERRRKDKTVVVAAEIRARAALARVVVILQTEALVIDKPLPTHYIRICHSSKL